MAKGNRTKGLRGFALLSAEERSQISRNAALIKARKYQEMKSELAAFRAKAQEQQAAMPKAA